ncbi:MAG TPA: prolipoprotein diacylglyceryl transferase [Terriglobales bacterium]|nr:prolipoprotein diacylglyceryl transferase [Terriglobales bacterium]
MFPRLFHIGSFNVPTYGFLVALGVLIGLWISVRNSQKQGIDPDHAWNLGILVVLCGILGAKILYIINDWSTYAAHPGEIFSLSTLQAGGVFSGGLIAALLAAAWYIRKHHMPALGTCDAFAPGLALGHAIGRIGCFSAGCCYGKPTTHWWGVTFTSPLAAELVGTPLNQKLQPTQLFESAVELANFFLLTWMLKRKKFEGQVFGAYLVLYGVARYFLEFIRDDPGRGSVFGGIMSGTQLISIFLVITGGLIWWWRPALRHVPAHATR